MRVVAGEPPIVVALAEQAVAVQVEIQAHIVVLLALQIQVAEAVAHIARVTALFHLTHLAQVVLALSLFATNQQLSAALVER
jgi:hypothetical protein